MFAIFEDGSRQYRVEPGTKLLVDYRDGIEPGATITFGRILLANGGGASQIGAPILDGATVTAEVIRPEFKGEKLEIGKFKKRKNSRRHVGHRQKHTLVRVSGIEVPGLEIVERKAEEPKSEATASE
ncbi:MAG: 50S ribosomal protein L21 [Planctomycetaceae bacterium]|nr:50S ribosomal protein L21 [Planctomycetaceae bacterium]